MKKLSLLLALLLVVSCALVACSSEEEASSTPADESVAESTPADESSEAEVEESSEAAVESSEPEEESSKVEIGELGDIISAGKSYTTTAPNRGDADSFNDDGKRLTNGTKGLEDAGTAESAGWNSLDKSQPNVVEITVDLGEAMESIAYTVYFAGGNWGIGLPNGETGTSIEIFASDSADGEFVSVAAAPGADMILKSGDGEATDAWSTFTLTAGAAETVNARYIKFVLTAAPVGNAFIWIDEVEVYAPAA